MDSTQFSNFKSLRTFSYLVPLSAENANSIDSTGQVPYGGTWYLVVSNTGGLNSLSLTGHITASMSLTTAQTGLPVGLILLVVGVVVIVLVIVVVVVAGRKLYEVRKSRQPQVQQPSAGYMTQYQGQNLFCQHCGAQLGPGAQFCPRCGRRSM